MRKIPPALAQRLRKVAPRLENSLKRLAIADHRTREGPGATQNNPLWWGGRVRQLNASRNFSEPIILKRVHPVKGLDEHEHHHATAPNFIRAGIRTVKNYRTLFHDHMEANKYRLVQIPAVAISQNLIAMARTNAPTVEEFDWHMRPSSNEYLKRALGKDWNGYQNHGEDYSPLVKRIRKVGNQIRVRLLFDETGDNDIFFVGVDKKGYLIFMLTADVQNHSHLLDKTYPGSRDENFYRRHDEHTNF